MPPKRNYRGEKCPKDLIEIASFIFVCFVTITVSSFELFMVLPTFYEPGSFWYVTHVVFGTFLLFNIIGNYALMICVDTSVRGSLPQHSSNYRYCQKCLIYAPPRSWHCELCNTCILKRDHHCIFTGYCIGYFNYRYFAMCVVYMLIGNAYAMYFNLCYIVANMAFSSSWALLQFLFPLSMVYYRVGISELQLCLFLFWGNLSSFIFMLILLIIHVTLVYKGTTRYESRQRQYQYDLGWKQNCVEVFGKRGLLALISPFTCSELPGNGIEWRTKET